VSEHCSIKYLKKKKKKKKKKAGRGGARL
jgi:hypothetical protein